VAWTFHILNSVVRAELEALPEDMRARLARIVELIEGHGLEKLREPLVKHLGKELWEIRVSGRDGISRVIYVTASGMRVVVVRVFIKKSQKTPPRELGWHAKGRRRLGNDHDRVQVSASEVDEESQVQG
jgi:phage-related protein